MILFAALSLLWATACKAADDPNNIFNFPGPAGPTDNFAADLVWSVGSTENIEFLTTLNDWNIILAQQLLGADINLVSSVRDITW